MAQSSTPIIVRFGAFELDVANTELRKGGLRVRIQDQPLQVLLMLLARPGEVVTREEIGARLWPEGTFVDFDRGLNAALARLRQVLGDSADAPRYVETVARRGYRFIGSVERTAQLPELRLAAESAPEPESGRKSNRSRIWLAATASLVLAAAGASWLVIRSEHHEFGYSAKVAVLTGAAGVERNPSFSPDGTQVVYEWVRENGRPHLYLKMVGPGDAVALTSGSGAEYSPAWSPDGKSIAFIMDQGSSIFGVFVIEPVGGTARKVADVRRLPLQTIIRRPYRHLDWTRDSRHLIVSVPGQGLWESLLLVSIETGEKRWLTHPPADPFSGDREPAVSPDGSVVVFARGGLNAETLYMLPLTSDLRPAGAPRPISAVGPARSPAWMPDGKQLIFTTLKPNMMSGFALSWISLESGKPPRHLVALGNSAATPAVSRQGRLAYSTFAAEGIIWRQDIPLRGNAAVPPVALSSAAAIQLEAEYSPDGRRIAFASERSGTREVWNCASDGAHCVRVTSFNSSLVSGFPHWSPDGKHLIFDSMISGHSELYIVDAHGGAPRRIAYEGPPGDTPYWSRDGRWIYYSVLDTGGRQIWRIPAAGGKAVQITRNGGFVIVDSSDSKTLYYTKNRLAGKLFRSAADGSGETEVLSGWNWGFAVAHDRVYYLRSTSDTLGEIREFVFGSGTDSHVARVDKALAPGLSLSPDGKSLIYSELRLRANLRLAENLY